MANKDSRSTQDFFHGKAAADFPLIPLRDTVVFPRIAAPLMVRREKSLVALEAAMAGQKMIVFSAQRKPEAADPGSRSGASSGGEEVYRIGTLARIKEIVPQRDKSQRVLVEGAVRVRIREVAGDGPYPKATVEPMPEPSHKKTEKIEALAYSCLNQFRRVVNMGANVPFDVLLVIMNVTDPWLLSDLIASNVEFKTEEKQEILEAATVEEKLERIGRALGRQIKILAMASKIQADTGKELDKMQREVFLREQMKSIEKELEGIGSSRSENDELRERLEKAGMSEETKEKAMKEFERLRAMPSFSQEISHLRAYLEWLADLPWGIKSESAIDMAQAKTVLDHDHFGLEKVKERILEYLAVQKLAGKIRGPILCFVGPPGTGKTSLGQSIARSIGRKFHRISLGGIRDEAEIRGHRRTYVGALPGRIIQGMAAVKTRNPVFMLDEIDKIGTDFRGDPSAALLEALDPEQNFAFSDHYLEAPFDLSDTLFITTANRLDTIPPALLDRLEVIEFAGYTDLEKLAIAKDHLVPKTLKENGLGDGQCVFSDEALAAVIRLHTREAGVRNLERQIASVCRKVAKGIAEMEKGKKAEGGKVIGIKDLSGYLGPIKYSETPLEADDRIGVVNGLAWTEAGGEILPIEAIKMSGKGVLQLTGHLGQVMQESAQAAWSYARSVAPLFGLKDGFVKTIDVHVHVPSGGIPKDGPSAGIAMATVLVSMLTGKKIRRDIAMTGEITLHGKAMEIGGLKEKLLAADRAGIRTVLIPADNVKDLVDVPEEVKKRLEIIPVKDMKEVLEQVFSKTKIMSRSKVRQ